MASAVVPAAGRSRRMGRPKLLLPFGRGTVLGSTLAALAGGGTGRIAVVTRPDDEDLAAWLAGEALGEIARRTGSERGAGPALVPAVNPDPARGMLSSILAGLDALAARPCHEPGQAGLAPLLVCPGDLPAVSADTVRRVLEAASGRAAALAVPVHRGKRGHPLAVGGTLIPEIGELDPAVGLRQLLERHPDAVVEVPVDDPGSVRDLDTPEDYRELRP
ncbi:MAG: NTP transferase domain-containing protein [Thermoanaerobaculia bacterium]